MFDHGRIVEHDDRAILAAQGGSRYRHLLELALEVDVVTSDDRPPTRTQLGPVAPRLAGQPARAALVLARLGRVRRVLLACRP